MFSTKKELRSIMESPVVFVLILSIISFETAPAYSQSIYASENPLQVDSNVTLFSETPVTAGAWMFNNNLIVMIYPGSMMISDTWKNRVTFNSSTSSLTVRSVQVSDSGLYTLQAMNSFRAQLALSVQVPISNVTLWAKATHLVEFNDTAVLVCSVANGTSLSYVWHNGSSVVTAGRDVQLSDGGATLSIVRVTHYDEGPFWCNVSNGISYGSSLPVHLNISYGPSNLMMTMVPTKYIYITGSNITLSCSAESSPPALIQWMVNGTYLDQFAPQLQLERVTESNAGNYQCLFHNTVTSRFSSASAVIRILEPLSGVVVNHTGGPAILHEPFTLYCEVTGPVSSIQWWKNGYQLLLPDNSTIFDTGNRTLTLNPVQLSDNGEYQCQALNYVSSIFSSQYTVEVNYGPMTPVITGSSMALTGERELFSCASNSYPPSQISWYFKDSLVANTSSLQIGPLTLNMSGKYICMAFNTITGRNSSAYLKFTVLAPVIRASIKSADSMAIMNHTFALTCETAGGVESIMWMYNWSPLYPDDRRIFSMDNATLTFDPVIDSDSGSYYCVASNPLSTLTSQVFMLDVYYGPAIPVITGPKAARAGDSITLSCYASANPPSLYKWFFSDSVVANSSEYITPPLTRNMSGMYTCMAYNSISNSTAYTILTVVDPIMDIQVETPKKPAIEGHFYDLICNVTGPAEHIYWLKNGEPLRKDNRTVSSMDNKTLAFNPVEHNDTGNYQCMATNSLWNMTSPPYMLLVNFGPDKPTIDGPAFAETGHTAVFNCYAKSMPPSQFSWWFNGSEVANTSVFTTDLLSFNMSGEYTCMAYNHVTGKNNTSSTMLTVIEAIQSVRIRNNTIPINTENFTLACEVTGPYDMIYWMKDYVTMSPPTATANESYHVENKTLHFTPVTMYNDGMYQCIAINQAGPHTSSQYILQVNYGPLHVSISGPDSAPDGSSVTLMCSADSFPYCDFHWFLSNQSSVMGRGSVITFPAVKKNEGTYICKARNPVTNITMYQTKVFTVDHASAIHTPSRGCLMLMGLFALSVTVLFN